MRIRQEIMFKKLTIVRAESRGSQPQLQRFCFSIYVFYNSWFAVCCRKKDASQAGLTLSTMTFKAACFNLQGP